MPPPPRVVLTLSGAPPPQQQPQQRSADARARRASAAARGACFAAAAGAAAVALSCAAPATATAAAPAAPVTNVGPRKPTKGFWSDLWSNNNIAFHKQNVHETLIKYRKPFLGDAPGRVLVPLCGKTHDLAWLAKQPGVSEVVGVEFVRQALDEFAAEHKELPLKKTKPVGPYREVLASPSPAPLTLCCGDIFALPATPAFSRVWDRASLVALDPKEQARYVARITAALAPRGVVLLQVLHRVAGPPLALAGGPPFSVTEADVKALYGSAFEIKKLEETDAMGTNPRFKASGLTKVTQVTYLLTKKA